MTESKCKSCHYGHPMATCAGWQCARPEIRQVLVQRFTCPFYVYEPGARG